MQCYKTNIMTHLRPFGEVEQSTSLENLKYNFALTQLFFKNSLVVYIMFFQIIEHLNKVIYYEIKFSLIILNLINYKNLNELKRFNL